METTKTDLEQGDTFRKAGQWKEALQCYQTAAQLEPNNWLVHHQIGDVFLNFENYKEAVHAYQKAIELGSDSCWSYCNLGRSLQKLNRLEEAIPLMYKATELKPDFAWGYYHLGDILVKKKQWDEAVAIYEKALEAEPNKPLGYIKIVEVLRRNNRLEEAFDKCEEGLSIHPENPNLLKLKQVIKIKESRISRKMAMEIAETLFDNEFYKKQYALEQNLQSFTKAEIFQHFLEQDLNSNHLLAAPTSWFFPEIYRDIHSPHQFLKLNPFLHYLMNGYAQGLQPLYGVKKISTEIIKERIEPLFDVEFYLDNNPDLNPNQVDPLEHFILYGWREERNPNSWFNLLDYQRKVPIVRDLGINPLYFYACLYSGDPRRWTDKKSDQHESKFGKALKITPKRETHQDPKSAIDFQSLLKQAGYFQSERYAENLTKAQPNRLKIHFVIPEFSKGGGGHMTIFRIVRWLEFFGHECTVWVQNPDLSRHPTGWRDDVYRYFQQVKASFRPLNTHFWYTTGDILIATAWETVEAVVAHENVNDRFYLVQDYEPYFFARGSTSLRAEDTYRQDIACICASSWLKKLMEEKFGRWARHFNLAYESDVYRVYDNDNPNTALDSDQDSLCHLIVYSRKHTARRAVELCLEALDELALRRDDFVVHFFGDEEMITDISYQAFHHGVMDKHELADLYNYGTLGVTFSATNYSLVPQEMMACGLPIVEIDNESTVSIFPSDVVSLARPNPKAIADTIEALMNDPLRREHQKNAALEWISDLSWETSVRAVEKAFLDHLREIDRLDESGEPSPIEISEKYPYHAAVMIPTFNGGQLFIEVLTRVRQQHTPWPFQIVIVDSSSNDGTQDYLNQQQDIILHTIPQSQFQHGATRNLGVKLSNAEYIAFLTQDALPTGNYWLYDLVSCLETHPSAAGVFGRHIAYEEATEFTKRDMLQHFEGFDQFPMELSLQTDFEKLKWGDQGWQQVLHYYSDNNSCLRRSVWQKHPYPEVAYGEDQLWADMIIKAGYSKIYSKAALVYHSHDYDYQETFKRAKTEAEFFFACFGYKMVTDRKQMEIDLAGINRRDIEYGKEKGLKIKEIVYQLNLNRAKFEGWASK